MISILFLGFLIGLHHALEADHVAAVSSLVAGTSGLRRILSHGAAWGLGHGLTLLLVGGSAVVLKTEIDGRLADLLECLVGVMLIGLGGQLLHRLWRDRIHFHRHRHDDGTVHFHAHSHRGETRPHRVSQHEHRHYQGGWHRSLVVGLVHGLAGSAALVVLTATSLEGAGAGLAFVLLFGLGSILGMLALSAAIAVPLSFTARRLTLANQGLQACVGLATCIIGVLAIVQTLPGLGAP